MPPIQTELHYSFFAALTVLTVIFCVFAFSIFHHVRKKRRQMKTKNYQDENNMEAERRRIAADLHDDLGSLLIGLNLSFKTLAERDPSNVLFRSSSDQLGTSLMRLREISLNLLPRELEIHGLNAAIESFVERMNVNAQIKVNYINSAEMKGFDNQKAMLLFRVIQEFTANAIKHSGTSVIDIGIAKRNSHLIVEMRDNGCGFDYEAAYKMKKSSGLKNIQSRLELLNATLFVESENGRGTHYFINIPLKQMSNGN
jgi:two-component system NarL family sensor kinase